MVILIFPLDGSWRQVWNPWSLWNNYPIFMKHRRPPGMCWDWLSIPFLQLVPWIFVGWLDGVHPCRCWNRCRDFDLLFLGRGSCRLCCCLGRWLEFRFFFVKIPFGVGQAGVDWHLRFQLLVRGTGCRQEKDPSVSQNVLRLHRLHVHGRALLLQNFLQQMRHHVVIIVSAISFCTFLKFEYPASSKPASSTYFQVSHGCPSFLSWFINEPILQVRFRGHALYSSTS